MVLVSKAIIILFLIFIFYALGSGLYYLVKDKGNSTRIVKALSWRIGLSLLLFVLLLIGFGFGWIVPHSL